MKMRTNSVRNLADLSPAMRGRSGKDIVIRVLPLALMVVVLASSATAQSTKTPSPAPATSGQPGSSTTASPPRYHPGVPKRATQYYTMVWGVDSLDVKWTESGEVIRFSYRVLDP